MLTRELKSILCSSSYFAHPDFTLKNKIYRLFTIFFHFSTDNLTFCKSSKIIIAEKRDATRSQMGSGRPAYVGNTGP